MTRSAKGATAGKARQVSNALDGLRVVELGQWVAAPFCARLLGDFGADVLKVELPGGDPSRHAGPFLDDEADPDDSGLFHFVNAGKQGVCADLDDPDQLDWLHEQLRGADVFVENLDPAAP